MNWCRKTSTAVLLCCLALSAAAETLVKVRVLSRLHPQVLEISGDDGRPVRLDRSSRYPVSLPVAGGFYRVAVIGGGETRRYSGALHAWWEGDEILLVNEVPLEDYVAGVVAAEMLTPHRAAARAQAVLSRTWAWRHRRPGRRYAFGDLANHQVFHGFSLRAERLARELSSTRGLVLAASGRPIDAVFHAECADRVYSAREIWGAGDHEYLQAVALPAVVADVSQRRWTRRLSREDVDPVFEAVAGGRPDYRVERRNGRLGVSLGPKTWLGIDRFRLMVDRALGWNTLRSNRFSILVRDGELFFSGMGFGHLVGMCQAQANELARQGWSYEQLLQLFYPAARLVDAEKVE